MGVIHPASARAFTQNQNVQNFDFHHFAHSWIEYLPIDIQSILWRDSDNLYNLSNRANHIDFLFMESNHQNNEKIGIFRTSIESQIYAGFPHIFCYCVSLRIFWFCISTVFQLAKTKFYGEEPLDNSDEILYHRWEKEDVQILSENGSKYL